MNKKIIGVLSAIIILLGGGYTANEILGGQGGGLPVRVRCSNNSGTTTPEYFVVGTTASSTCDIFVADMNGVDLLIDLIASTTASVFQYEIAYAYDDNISVKDYYTDVGSVGNRTSATSFSVSLIDILTPANAEASSTLSRIGIEPIRAKHLRITYLCIIDDCGVNLDIIGRNEIR